MAEPVNVDEQPPTLQQPSTSQAPAEAAAAGEATLRRSDDKYAPTLFYGKSSEDGETYVAYTEHYKTDKHLSATGQPRRRAGQSVPTESPLHR